MLILDEEDKIRTAEDVDRIVSAEIPCSINQPKAYETVIKCMNHGYCGLLNPQSPCMDNGICTKKYPKQFIEATTIQNDGYPTYRRRNNGRTFTNSRGQEFNNTHIVPHNLVLATEFDCHINVEVCSSIRAIKYIYKYILKGKIIYFRRKKRMILYRKK